MPTSALGQNSDISPNGLLIVMGLVLFLAVVTVALRFYTRKLTNAGIKWDDWLILAATVVALVTTALGICAGAIARNRPSVPSTNTGHSYVLTPKDILFHKVIWSGSLLYFSAVGWTKLGILLMYNRIFNVDDVFRWQLMVAGFLVVGWWISGNIVGFTGCIPLDLSWSSPIPRDPSRCLNVNIFWVAAGICEVFIDIVILVLPIRAVMAMQLSAQKKTSVACIFLLGGFVVITGLLKAIYGFAPGQHEPFNSVDKNQFWAILHVRTAIICASLPIFKPLVKQIFESTLFKKLRKTFLLYKSFGSHSWSLRYRSGSRRPNMPPEEAVSRDFGVERAAQNSRPVKSESTLFLVEAARRSSNRNDLERPP